MNLVLVAPLVGAWIEIINSVNYLLVLYVAPLVGAWIEINTDITSFTGKNVAPLVGAWIEIPVGGRLVINYLSLLSWERGLKFYGLGYAL